MKLFILSCLLFASALAQTACETYGDPNDQCIPGEDKAGDVCHNDGEENEMYCNYDRNGDFVCGTPACFSTVDCSSNDDCEELGAAFCNFDYGTSGFCELCCEIDDCETEDFRTKEGNKACMEVCEDRVECSSRPDDDCKELGQAFCNFDFGTSGFCELCCRIDDCATEPFITKEGNKACAEVCDAGPSGCKQYDNVYGDCLDFTNHDEGEGSYELCSLSCLNSETCVGIQTDSGWQGNCEHLKSLEGVEGCPKGEFTIISRECFENPPEPWDRGCFLDPSTPIDDCECDPSCASCGYYESPTEPADCITCADGSDVIPFYDDGTGFCSGRAPEDSDGCYKQPGVPIAPSECKCDPSCKSCGYYAKPTLPSDCIICADGSEVKPIYPDGTGYCGQTPDPILDAGCFLNDLVMIPNCKCHPSCKSCGYTFDPTSAANCITCIDGSEVNPVYGDGTGTCGPTVNPQTDSGCFEDPATFVADCKCDPSCKSCGYYEEPSNPDDCITCADGSEVTPVWGDGTGTCQ